MKKYFLEGLILWIQFLNGAIFAENEGIMTAVCLSLSAGGLFYLYDSFND